MTSFTASILSQHEPRSLLHQSRFWAAQLGGWLLVVPFYFRDLIQEGLRNGLVLLSVTMVTTSWIAVVALSTVLAAAYLRMYPHWLRGIRAIPAVLALSCAGALPWTAMLIFLLRSGQSNPSAWGDYAPWLLFQTTVLLSAWSGTFLWFLRRSRQEPGPARRPDVEDSASRWRSDSDATQGRWRPNDRVCLKEGKRMKFCVVGEIVFIQAAGDYTEIHLADDHVAIVRQRLVYWESRLPESFVRIHRSTLVNLERSDELVYLDGAWRFRLRGLSEPVAVSKRFEQSVIAKVTGQGGKVSV
ncbi:MAG: LytTR family DNA-binding domain-containing protein [Myxococcota bacterium]